MANNFSIQPKKRLTIILLAVPFLLLIPFIAMQFSDEVQWSFFDFAVAGFLLICTGLLCELVLRKFKTLKSRVLVCALIFLGLALIWAELAVGVFGTPFAGN